MEECKKSGKGFARICKRGNRPVSSDTNQLMFLIQRNSPAFSQRFLSMRSILNIYNFSQRKHKPNFVFQVRVYKMLQACRKILLPVLFACMAQTGASQEPSSLIDIAQTREVFKEGVKFTQEEKHFLRSLAKDNEELSELAQAMSGLLMMGIATEGLTPMSVRDIDDFFVEASKACCLPAAKDDTLEKAFKGLKQLSAKPIYERLTLFLIGRDAEFAGYKPKGDSQRFFKALQSRFYKAMVGDQ